MTYSEKLRDPRWQKKRLEIMERDGWRCVCCGDDSSNLQIHHLVYRKLEPWGYPDYLYQTLCADCHKKRQEITDRIVDAIRIAIKNVPTPRLIIVAQHICDNAMLEIEVAS